MSTQNWIQTIQNQVISHPNWIGDITATEAAQGLEGEKPFTYVLWSEKKTHQYFMSFVDQERMVEHLSITLDAQGCYHKNGWGTAPFRTIDLLIQEIMRHIKIRI